MKTKKINGCRKGKAGEVEFCKWLLENFQIDIDRNYNQSNGYSADIIASHFIFEVKRQEVLDFKSWWYQVSIAKQKHKEKNKEEDLIPVVAFRQNRKAWKFLIPANLLFALPKSKKFMLVEENVFIPFMGGLTG